MGRTLPSATQVFLKEQESFLRFRRALRRSDQLADTPCIDKGFYVLVGNNHYVMQSIAARRPRAAAARFSPGCSAPPRATRRSSSIPAASRSGSTSPGDARSRARRARAELSTSRRGRSFARSSPRPNELGLPHPVHIHCNNSACPATGRTTLETMRALEGHRGHITHIQFHSYGGGDGDENTFDAKSRRWPSMSTRTRTSRSTSARCCSARRRA